MKFFVPDWDDRVDPGYDFASDRFSLVRDPYADDRYAHEMLVEPGYDGILLSRMALGESGPKRAAVERFGVRAYLRMPARYELLGDCGAFGYVAQRDPTFETGELLNYYQRLGFDYGVSIDHLIYPEFADQRQYRYDLTLRNAEEFLSRHSSGGYRFTPIAAIQGWDLYSYVDAAKAVVAMGYEYLAVGGLARSNTRIVRDIVGSVRNAIPSTTRIHVFGVARLTMLADFLAMNVTSVDSAAPLRQAWLSAKDNYYAVDSTYAAIRIPVTEQERPKSKTLIGRSAAAYTDLVAAEAEALAAVRTYDHSSSGLDATIDTIMRYDGMLAARLDPSAASRHKELYRAVLKAKPWKHCPCEICRAIGIEVIIFRGNNRNRRRGFHNLWTIRQRILTAQQHGITPTHFPLPLTFA